MRPPPGARRARLRAGVRRSARRRSCTRATSLHLGDAGGEQALARRSRAGRAARHRRARAPQRRIAPPGRPRSSIRPRPGPTTATIGTRRAPSSRSVRDALLEHARGEAPPAGMEHRDGARRSRARRAGSRRRAPSRRLRRMAVAWPSASIASGSPAVPVDALDDAARPCRAPGGSRTATAAAGVHAQLARGAIRPCSGHRRRRVERLPSARAREQRSTAARKPERQLLGPSAINGSARLERGAQLGVAAAGELAVELARAAPRSACAPISGPASDAGREQVVAGDLQAHVTQRGRASRGPRQRRSAELSPASAPPARPPRARARTAPSRSCEGVLGGVKAPPARAPRARRASRARGRRP